MAKKPLPCPTVMRLLADYNPDTGALIWKSRPLWMFTGSRPKNAQAVWNSKWAGKPAFSQDNGLGYPFSTALGARVKAHRAAWVIHHGFWPTAEIDHINRCTKDNRLANLREATRFQNARNVVPSVKGSSRYRGVHTLNGGRTWRAAVSFNGKVNYLGSFRDERDAATAYDAAARELHGEFAILNFG